MKRLRLALTLLIVGSGFAVSTHPARAADCPKKTEQAIIEAQAALDTNNPDDTRRAIACLIAAVSALNKEVVGMTNGTVRFRAENVSPSALRAAQKAQGK